MMGFYFLMNYFRVGMLQIELLVQKFEKIFMKFSIYINYAQFGLTQIQNCHNNINIIVMPPKKTQTKKQEPKTQQKKIEQKSPDKNPKNEKQQSKTDVKGQIGNEKDKKQLKDSKSIDKKDEKAPKDSIKNDISKNPKANEKNQNKNEKKPQEQIAKKDEKKSIAKDQKGKKQEKPKNEGKQMNEKKLFDKSDKGKQTKAVINRMDEDKNEKGKSNEDLIKESGLLEAYEQFLRTLCKYGLPTGDVYEFAAQQIQKFQRKKKAKELKLKAQLEIRKAALKKSQKLIDQN